MKKILSYPLSGFQEEKRLFETKAFSFHAALDMAEQKHVVIRKAKPAFFKKAGLDAFKREYELLSGLNIEGIISPLTLALWDSGSTMVCRPFKGLLINDVLNLLHTDGKKNDVQIEFFADPVSFMLVFGMAVTEVLGHLHRKGIVHGAIRPEAMAWDPIERKVTFLDLFYGRKKFPGNEKTEYPVLPAPDLKCIPSGQTEASLDFRSDLYCLGALFYYLLTGVVPFDSTDQPGKGLSVPYQAPVLPHALKPEIPPVLSRIVMKLISEKPEDRYQSTFGLLNDIKEVFRKVRHSGNVEEFRLGEADLPDRLAITPLLYGREQEIQTLLSSMERAAHGSMEVIFISGAPGIGKSRIVEEIVFSCRKKDGLFISTRFDRLRQNVPYAALKEGIKSLMQQVLAKKADRIDELARQAKQALGSNLGIMIDAIPEIALLTGNTTPVRGLSSVELKHRFNLAVYRFLEVLARFSGLMVIYFKDMQWMDPASLRLIRTVFSQKPIGHLMLIFSFRTVSDTRPVMIKHLASTVKKAGTDPVFINVKPWSAWHTRQMIADTLFLAEDKIDKFAEAIHNSTNGNPFYIIQTIKALNDEGLIRYEGQWIIEPGAQKRAKQTGGLMALMSDRMEKLPPDVSALLQAASSIGTVFESGMLARACGMDEDAVKKMLAKAQKEGFILFSNNLWQFAHEGIRDGFYEMIGTRKLARIHYRIGRLLLADTDSHPTGHQIFEVVHHLNIAASIIKDRPERIELARINLAAGISAKDSSAYEAARAYLETGLDLLDKNAWSEQYDLALRFHSKLCEIGFLLGDTEKADFHYNQVLNHAKKPADRVRTMEIRMVMYTTGNRPLEALAIGLEALGMLGLRLAKNPGKGHVLWNLVKAKYALSGLSVYELAALDELTDPEKLAVSRILMRCIEAAYVTDHDFLLVFILKMIVHTIKNGNSKHSIFSYAAYGAILGSVFGEYEKGREYEKLALRLLEKYRAEEFKAKTYMLIGAGIHHWTRPMRESLNILKDSYKYGMESGEYSFAAYGLTSYLYTLFFIGTPLDEVLKTFTSHLKEIERLHQESCHQEYLLWFDLVSRLSGKKGLKMEKTEKRRIIEQWRNALDMNRLCIHEIGLTILAYMEGRLADALSAADQAGKMLDAVTGQVFVSEYFFYHAAAILRAIFRDVYKPSRKDKKRLFRGMGKFRKWAEHAPDNYRHQYLFISAGVAAVKKNMQKAALLFESSVSCASENGFIHDEAVIAELAGLFLLTLNDTKKGYNYICRSHRAYSKWGALPKAEAMEKVYPFLTDCNRSRGLR